MKPDIVAYLDDLRTERKEVRDLVFDIIYNCTFPDQVILYFELGRLASELKRIVKRKFDLVLLMDEDGEDVYALIKKKLCPKTRVVTTFVRRKRKSNWDVCGVESSKRSKPLKEQINGIIKKIERSPKKIIDVALIDDVIFSGTTLKYFIKELKKKTKKKLNFYGIALLIPSEKYPFLKEVYTGFKVPGRTFDGRTGKCDILCLKDFIWKEDAIGAMSYINNKKWMRDWYFANHRRAKKNFLEIKKLTKEVFSKN